MSLFVRHLMKPPGGEVTVISILWMLIGIAYLVMMVMTQDWLLILWAAGTIVPAVLLWRGSCRAANFMIFCLIATVFVGIVKMATGYIPKEQFTREAVRIVIGAYCVFPLWKWSDERHAASRRPTE